MRIRLLLVDDAPFIHEVLHHLFDRSGIEVVGDAYDGFEAVELAEELKPDVVLMDIVMPKKSGLEASVEILKILPDTKIIACSTVDSENLVSRALEAGCCDFVRKPFTGQGLVEVIKKSHSSAEPATL